MPTSQPPLSQPPVTGLVAAKYEIVRLIGRGGMGSVWEGRHASLGTRVAVKFIDPEYARSKDAQSRFVNEARAVATIQSKHAIQIFDHGVTDDGRPYIVMELLLGEPLDKRLERVGRMSLQETARMIVQVCRALQRAHDAGIIHRDLKPENIFLVRSPDDDDEIAKVLDFGIAKIKGPPGEKGMTSSTKTGAVLGTPYYMSPEQARGLRTIDHRSDLWSLGVIAFKCATGVLPFDGESVGDLLVKICTLSPPRPSMTIAGLPPTFDAWFLRALESEPARRFSTATELAEALGFAAGISVKRGGASNPEGAPAMTESPGRLPVVPYAATPLPTGGMTSAPFVTSASIPKSSKGAIFIVIAAALLGATIGVFAVVKYLSASKDIPASAASPAPASARPADTTAPTSVTSLSALAVPSSIPEIVPPLKASTPTPTATVVRARPPTFLLPAAKAPSAPTAAPPPIASSQVPSAQPAKPASASKPLSNSADPGY
jgi:serine/threonine-protein kinase